MSNVDNTTLKRSISPWYISYDHSDHVDLRVYSRGFNVGIDEEKCTLRFQLFDDDDNKIYSGFMCEVNHSPLDCYGMPNAGCTYLKYKVGRKWEVL